MQTELEELECIYCELHKDVYGVKARWYKAASIEQARKDLDGLEAQGKEIWAAEARAKAVAGVAFEARIQQVIGAGAGTRAAALRWIHDAEGSGGDEEYLCYLCGLEYGYFRKV